MFVVPQIRGIAMIKLLAQESLQTGARAAAQVADIAQPQHAQLVQRTAHGIVMTRAAAQELAEIGANQEVQVMDIVKILHAQPAVLRVHGIVMMKLLAKEQQEIGARVLPPREELLHTALAGVLQVHAQPAPQLQNIIVIQKQTVKEQQEAGVHINRQEAHTQAAAVAIVLIPAQLILVRKPSTGIAKMKAHAKLQERAGAPALEATDIVQTPAQLAIKLIHGTAIQKKHVLV